MTPISPKTLRHCEATEGIAWSRSSEAGSRESWEGPGPRLGGEEVHRHPSCTEAETAFLMYKVEKKKKAKLSEFEQ